MLFAGIMLSISLKAQVTRLVISGYVLDEHTGYPIVGHAVYLTGDSSQPYTRIFDTLITSETGYFADTLTASASISALYHLWTLDCNNNPLDYFIKGFNPESPYYFEICSDNPLSCHAQFSYEIDNFNPLKVFFDNHSYGSDFFFWDFGDGGFSYFVNPVHFYSQPGTYTVKLISWDNQPANCIDSITHIITLSFPEVEAHFSYTQNPFNPLETYFQNQCNNNAHHYKWEFGDGTSSTLKNPYKKYEMPGNYTVKLVVYDQLPVFNSIDSTNKTISQDSNLFYNLAGQVFQGTFPGTTGTAEVYRQEGQYLVFEESTNLNENGVYYFYKKFFGHYYIRAHELQTSTQPLYMPTYTGNSLFWQQADNMMVASNLFTGDISLVSALPLPSGPGQISGHLGKNSAGSVIPVGNVSVFLMEPSGIQAYNVYYSLETGYFSFTGLPYGTYLIYPEITGKWTTPLTVVIDSLHPTVDDLSFVVETSSVAAINDPEPQTVIQMSCYPNPCINSLELSMLSLKKQTARLRVSDLTGRILISRELNLVPGTNSFDIDLKKLLAGNYLLYVEMNSSKTVKKISKLSN